MLYNTYGSDPVLMNIQMGWEKNFKIMYRFLVWIPFLMIIGCDNQGAQEDFVAEAGADPSGITRILDNDFGGTICSEDEDDWRTSPVYTGIVLVERPAFPNPINGATEGTILLRVLQFDRVRGGFQLSAFGDGNLPIELGRITDASSPGEYALQFSPSLLTANGLHRLFVLDSFGELITYGDIELVNSLPTGC